MAVFGQEWIRQVACSCRTSRAEQGNYPLVSLHDKDC